MYPTDPERGFRAPISRPSQPQHVPDSLAMKQHVAALRAHVQESRQQLTEITERIAQTFADIACVYDHLADATRDPDTAARARNHAQRIRFAAHERHERHEPKTRVPDADPDAPSPEPLAAS